MLAQLLSGPAIRWKTVTIAPWYSQGERRVRLTSATTPWPHSGRPPVPIRWVLIRDLEGKLAPRVLLSTTPDLDPVQVLTWFVRYYFASTCSKYSSSKKSIQIPSSLLPIYRPRG
jgi:hypothetical protein